MGAAVIAQGLERMRNLFADALAVEPVSDSKGHPYPSSPSTARLETAVPGAQCQRPSTSPIVVNCTVW